MTGESNKRGLESSPERTDRGLLLKKVSRGSGCSISAPCWLRVWVSAGTGPWLASVWGMWSTWFIFKLLSSFTKKERGMINGDGKPLFMNRQHSKNFKGNRNEFTTHWISVDFKGRDQVISRNQNIENQGWAFWPVNNNLEHHGNCLATPRKPYWCPKNAYTT